MRSVPLTAALLLWSGVTLAQPPASEAPTSEAPASEAPAMPANEPAPKEPGPSTEPAGAVQPSPSDTTGIEAVTTTDETAPVTDRGFLWKIIGGEWSSKGEVGLETRAFQDDDDASTEDTALGLLSRVELRHSHGVLEEKVRLYGRLDERDRNRTVLVFEEAWIQAATERFRLRAGMDIVNWTATEAFHPADVINARNLDSDLENFEKVGEPMVALQVKLLDDTSLGLMYMPFRTEPIFTSPRSRLSFAPGQDLRGRRRMIDREGGVTTSDWGPQAAVVIRQVLGSADLTVHAIEHMDRSQPLVRLDPATMQPFLLFQTVRQVGGTYQQAVDALLIKLEGSYRMFVDPDADAMGTGLTLDPMAPRGHPDHGQIAMGLEYGIVHGNGSESTLLLEGQTLLGVDGEVQRSALSVFQRDVLAGLRFALNDEDGKEAMVGAVFDLERPGESLINVSYQQRLGETWTVRLGLRLFNAGKSDPTPLAALRKADHVRLTLTRHF